MKKLIAILAMGLMLGEAHASAAGSLFNGDHYELQGKMMVQDADSGNDFYWIPEKFKLRSKSEIVYTGSGRRRRGTLVNKQMISHSIVENENGEKFSRYDLTVKLEGLDDSTRLIAQSMLRRKHDTNARLVGRIPLCGIATGVPKSIGASGANIESIQVVFGFVEDGLETCSNFNVPKSFPISIIVPEKFEPGFAQSLVNGVGAMMPTIKLAMPYKYRDKATLSIDVEKAYKFINKSGSLTGTYKAVSAGVKANVRKMIRTLSYTGSIVFDIQNPDPKVRAHLEKTFIDIITKQFFVYTAKPDLTMPGDNDSTTPITFANRGGGSKSAPLVQAKFAFGEDEAREIGKINFSLENVNYGAMESHASIVIPPIDKERIHESIRSQLD